MNAMIYPKPRGYGGKAVFVPHIAMLPRRVLAALKNIQRKSNATRRR